MEQNSTPTIVPAGRLGPQGVVRPISAGGPLGVAVHHPVPKASQTSSDQMINPLCKQ